ncbi:hypothetical protein [Yersinia enterocolitica]|uniref:hypothetical protein n=1 Tax=Yersinia enterocolitica TaxID=630 RepID=UPI0005DABAA0|nr:hypothetical protein [Yersinia enterocolitica]CQH25044.1 Uncharacterised protein [Yersinia enterocolitica]
MVIETSRSNGIVGTDPSISVEPNTTSAENDVSEDINNGSSRASAEPVNENRQADEEPAAANATQDSTVNKYHSIKVTFLTITFCSIATILIWLVVLHSVLEPSFFKNLGFAKDYVLKKPDQQFDPVMMHNIGEMVTNGTLLSLDDFWSFQSNLYQTIITFLIALNGVIAAFSFFIIKTSSNAKAREEARAEASNELKKYLESTRFVDEVKRVVRNKVEANLSEIVGSFQFDLEEKTADIAEQIDAIALLRKDLKLDIDTIERINREHEDFKRYIAILAKSLSLVDRTEDAGADLTLGGK